MEPKYPGVVDRYVNMGDCYDREGLLPLRQPIMDCMTGYKECYARAYRCLAAAADGYEDIRAALLTDSLCKSLSKRADGILKREFAHKKADSPGRIKQRFLGAVSHRGPLCLYQTAAAQCGKLYELTDRCGLAHELLIPILSGAVERGYDAVACPDPMAPNRLAHLLIPEAGVAFLSTDGKEPLPVKTHRSIRLDAAADRELLRSCRPRMRFARKVSAALMEDATEALSQAKAIHDKLEGLYNPHVKFQLVEEMAHDIAEEILSF